MVSFDGHFTDEDALADALADADIVVTLRERVTFPGSLIARLPRLRLIVASGMRNSVIDHAAAEAHGVTVCGTANSSTPPVELTWALLLGLARGIVEESNGLRTGGPWQRTVGADLHGRRLGLLGLGKIGSRVAQVGLAFGMRVGAWSHHLTQERADEVGVELAPSVEDLLRESDFVSVHLALGERNRGLLGAAELALLKPTAYLVNASRAAIVDQDALLAALHDGRIAGAGVDVFDVEPLPAGHPMRTAPACSPPRTSATSPVPTTPRTTARRSRTSAPSSTAHRSGACPENGRKPGAEDRAGRPAGRKPLRPG